MQFDTNQATPQTPEETEKDNYIDFDNLLLMKKISLVESGESNLEPQTDQEGTFPTSALPSQTRTRFESYLYDFFQRQESENTIEIRLAGLFCFRSLEFLVELITLESLQINKIEAIYLNFTTVWLEESSYIGAYRDVIDRIKRTHKIKVYITGTSLELSEKFLPPKWRKRMCTDMVWIQEYVLNQDK